MRRVSGAGAQGRGRRPSGVDVWERRARGEPRRPLSHERVEGERSASEHAERTGGARRGNRLGAGQGERGASRMQDRGGVPGGRQLAPVAPPAHTGPPRARPRPTARAKRTTRLWTPAPSARESAASTMRCTGSCWTEKWLTRSALEVRNRARSGPSEGGRAWRSRAAPAPSRRVQLGIVGTSREHAPRRRSLSRGSRAVGPPGSAHGGSRHEGQEDRARGAWAGRDRGDRGYAAIRSRVRLCRGGGRGRRGARPCDRRPRAGSGGGRLD